MRNNIVHPGAANLTYEIREIVAVARKIEEAGVPITWENIGDPIEKGAEVSSWIKKCVTDAIAEDFTYGYSPTKGLLDTRKYIAHERNIEGGIQISPDDILFFNGLGDAISKLYRNLKKEARIIGPSPSYPTHSSAEAAHADAPHITYELDPYNGWQPDFEDLENKIKVHEGIVGILIVNPDNPTGFVYDVPTMERIVALAKKYGLFIISDEIYSNLVYGDVEYKKLASVIGAVPAIGMRGISKEFPWPGARCGWIEFYNREIDEEFKEYTEAIINSKMLEVCSTTLPQRVIPQVMGDDRYYPELKERNKAYKKRADIAHEILSKVPNITVHLPEGAFYMTVIFNENTLTATQSLEIANPAAQKIIEQLVEGERVLDKRFIYYLLGAKGICVVPMMTGFNANFYGFRFTLLEENEEKFKKTIETIAEAVQKYLVS